MRDRRNDDHSNVIILDAEIASYDKPRKIIFYNQTPSEIALDTKKESDISDSTIDAVIFKHSIESASIIEKSAAKKKHLLIVTVSGQRYEWRPRGYTAGYNSVGEMFVELLENL